MDRKAARAIIQAISAHDVYTRYRVESGKLYVSSPGGLLPEQRELVIEHRDIIVAYCTTPPPVQAECIRGHQIEWKFNPLGCWLCSCYSLPYASQTKVETDTQPAAASRKPSVKSYWLEEVAR